MIMEYFQGQYQHPMYPQWPIHPHGAPPIFQPYPTHAMPYYHNYLGIGPFFQPPYPPMDDPRFNPTQRVGQRRQSMESKDRNTESESGEPCVPRMRLQDVSELENEGSQGWEPRRKGGHGVYSGMKQYDYFELALKLHQDVERNGLNKKYRTERNINTTQLKWEFNLLGRPMDVCDFNRQNKPMLKELHFLVTSVSHTFVNNTRNS